MTYCGYVDILIVIIFRVILLLFIVLGVIRLILLVNRSIFSGVY